LPSIFFLFFFFSIFTCPLSWVSMMILRNMPVCQRLDLVL
jgi:hypothetical protein